MSTELAIRPDQSSFDDKQLAALRSIGVQNAPNADIALFFHQAARTGLDPFSRQIYLINRGGKWTIQTAIDGFRLIRDRKGTYRGHTEEWCGEDGVWHDVWLANQPPAAARVMLYVDGYVKPVPGIALWSEYAQTGRDGKPQALWATKPALMLAKCAEALALRKAYSQDLSGLYTTDEIPEAEQDADGVYVTTAMRSNSAQNPSTVGKTEARQQDAGHTAPDEQRTRPAATGKGRGRPESPAATPTTPDGGDDYAEALNNRDIANMWIERIQATDNMTALIDLRSDVVKRGSTILDYGDSDGHTVDQWFNRRRSELQQAAAGETEPTIMLDGDPSVYDDDSIPF